MLSPLENLIELSWRAVLARQDCRSGRSVSRPPVEPLSVGRLESRFAEEFPVLEYLDAALDLASNCELSDLASALCPALDQVRWSQNPGYTEANVSRSLLDGYAYAGLSGPDCPLLCEVPRCGYVLLAPGVTYQDHNHEPREAYLVLTPGAQWCLDSGEWFDVHAGDLILHQPWQMHAMRAGDQPLLAFAAWLESGDRKAIQI
jgi:hypothetical protein